MASRGMRGLEREWRAIHRVDENGKVITTTNVALLLRQRIVRLFPAKQFSTLTVRGKQWIVLTSQVIPFGVVLHLVEKLNP